MYLYCSDIRHGLVGGERGRKRDRHYLVVTYMEYIQYYNNKKKVVFVSLRPDRGLEVTSPPVYADAELPACPSPLPKPEMVEK